ncbi:MAG: hypothetical protein AAF677_02485 [Pseudomonadota bacterium]
MLWLAARAETTAERRAEAAPDRRAIGPMPQGPCDGLVRARR